MARSSITSDDSSDDEEIAKPLYCTLWSLITPILFCGFALFAITFLYVSLLYGNDYAESLIKSGFHSELDSNNVLMRTRNLTQFGPKVIGSEANEKTATQLILDELSKLKNISGPNKLKYYTRGDVSGCVQKEKPAAMTICYQNIQYILAQISANKSDAENILLSCHFDTVPNSVGASDDAVSCAVMLEVMETLMKDEGPLNRNVLFLFGGSEEYGLLGSHGFLKHEVNLNQINISAFINLDNCGSDGWQILYQSSSVDLVKLYGQSVIAPYGSVIAEELYLAGFVPSTTDYSVFHDYGDLHGINLALYKNSYIYHTRLDTVRYLNPGSVLYMGDTVLKLTKAFANKVAADITSKRAVYFDLFKQTMICLDQSTASVIGYAVAAASLFSILLISRIIHPDVRILGKFLGSFAIAISSYILVGVSIISISLLVDVCKWNMLWYTSSWLIVFIYGVPSFVTMTLPYALYSYLMPGMRRKRSEVALFMCTVQLIWTSILLCGIVMEIRSSYLLAIGLIPVTINNMFWGIVSCKGTCAYFWMMISQCVYIFFVGIYFAYTWSAFYELLIPASGRSGPIENSEFIVGGLTAVLCILLFCYYAPVVILLRRPSQLIFMLILALVACGVIVGLWLNVNPFTEVTPQHFHVLHIERKLYHYKTHVRYSYRDYIVYPSDRRGILTLNMLFPTNKIGPVIDSCSYNLYCGIPGPYQKYAYRSTASRGPEVIQPLLTWKISRIYQSGTCDGIENSDCFVSTKKENDYVSMNIDFSYKGTADRVKFAVSPDELIALGKWSLSDDKPPKKYISWNEREVYYFIYQRGNLQVMSFSFQITLQVPKNYNDKLLRLSMTNEFISSVNLTEDYKTFLESFPEWTDVSAWSAMYEEIEISV